MLKMRNSKIIFRSQKLKENLFNQHIFIPKQGQNIQSLKINSKLIQNFHSQIKYAISLERIFRIQWNHQTPKGGNSFNSVLCLTKVTIILELWKPHRIINLTVSQENWSNLKQNFTFDWHAKRQIQKIISHEIMRILNDKHLPRFFDPILLHNPHICVTSLMITKHTEAISQQIETKHENKSSFFATRLCHFSPFPDSTKMMSHFHNKS